MPPADDTMPLQQDRVRRHTTEEKRRAVDQGIEARVRACVGASGETLDRRIRHLEGEWDMERVLETNAAALALTGVLLGAFVDRRWLWLSGAVTGFLLQHALQGWCPPVYVFRRLGVRTRREIDSEKYAVKALRGDFEGVTGPDEALRAVRGERS